MKKYLNIAFLVFMLLVFISCDNDDIANQISSKKVKTEFFYKKWNFDKDQGSIKLSKEEQELIDTVYYVKTDLKGNRILKGILYNGEKHDFWTYYDLKGEITRIEFYVNGKITQAFDYE